MTKFSMMCAGWWWPRSAISRRRARCRRGSIWRGSRSSRRAIRHMAISRPTRRWCWRVRSKKTRWRWPSASPPAIAARELATGDYRGHGLTVAAARPGFLNIRLAPEVWHAQLRAVLRAGTAFGDSTMGAGERVNVEYVSANPTGPMHVGHGRGAVVGDALASLLAKAGFAVHREYYINDAGAQVDILARSLYLRYREALGERNRRDPRGPLSRRLPDRDRPTPWPNATGGNGSAGRKRMARAGARLRRRRR